MTPERAERRRSPLGADGAVSLLARDGPIGTDGAAPAGPARSVRRLLLERELELATIDRLIEEVEEGEGARLLIDGPAGIGKSTLLDATTKRARARGWRALGATGHTLAPQIGFGVARRLLATELGSDQEQEGDPDSSAPQLVSMRLVRTVLDAAASGPLLLAIDDVQWCDAASLRWLALLSANVWQAPVLLAIAVRAGSESSDPALGELLDGRADAVARPAPLSPHATVDLLATRLGGVPDQALADECFHVTGGNPYLVQTLGDALRQSQPAGEQGALAWVREVGSRALAHSLAARMDALDGSTRRFLEVAAVVGDIDTVAQVATIAGLDIDLASDCAARLAAAGLLASGASATLSHPLVGEAIRRSIPAAARAELRWSAALLLAERGEAEKAAAHLVDLPPRDDPRAAEILVEAADLARTHGAPETAAALLRRALAEQPGGPREAELRSRLGGMLLSIGDPGAAAVLAPMLKQARDPADRAALAQQLAFSLVLAGRNRDAVALLEHHTAELGHVRADLAEELEGLMIYFCSLDPVLRPRRVELLKRHGTRRGASELAFRTRLLGLADLSLCACDPAARTVALVQRAIAGGLLLSRMPSACPAAAIHLIQLGETRLARGFLQDLMTAARRQGDVVLLSLALSLHGEARRVEGSLAAAEADLRTALSLAGDRDVGVPFMVCGLLLVLLERDAITEAEQEVRRAGLTGEVPEVISSSLILCTRGRIRYAAGAKRQGLEDVLLAGDALRNFEVDTPASVPWRSAAATMLLELGEQTRAHELAAEEVALAQRIGAPTTLGPALRVHGSVLGGADGRALLERAVAVLGPSPARLEYARALCDLGRALRVAGEFTRARGLLHEAVALAGALGGTVLAARAQAELAQAGGRARRTNGDGPGSLTPAEQRVASLAAQGLTNRQIAETLVVSTKTVETHLSRVFRKLQITARSELERAIEEHAHASP